MKREKSRGTATQRQHPLFGPIGPIGQLAEFAAVASSVEGPYLSGVSSDYPLAPGWWCPEPSPPPSTTPYSPRSTLWTDSLCEARELLSGFSASLPRGFSTPFVGHSGRLGLGLPLTSVPLRGFVVVSSAHQLLES
jgi:hypothetical protein